MTGKPGIEIANLSDIGLQRGNNEDSFLYWEPKDAEEVSRKGRLAVIADGMGGHEGGQEASRIAVETVRDAYEKSFTTDVRAVLMEAFRAAHQQICDYAVQHSELQGMGTTCTAMAIVGNELFFAHVGDSRLYLVREGEISKLTHDHSYVGRLVETGIVRAEEAETHPQRHILTAALGAGRELAADVSEAPLELYDSDTLILCTDGLWGVVSEQELATSAAKRSPEMACHELVRLAIQRGGPDNITVQILRFHRHK